MFYCGKRCSRRAQPAVSSAAVWRAKLAAVVATRTAVAATRATVVVATFSCTVFASCAVFAAAQAGPSNNPLGVLPFVDITKQVGLDFRHSSSPSGEYLLPEIMGAGAALFDYDNDGDLDIYLVNSGGGLSRLFKQNSNGTFEDVTDRSGLGDPGYGMGVALGDIDNDGDVDLFVTSVGTDHLYRNDGDGTFVDITATSGIEGSYWSSSAVFCDVDGNDYLDLYVATYVALDEGSSCTTKAGLPDYCPPSAYRSVADQLFLNRGDGTFEKHAERAGISQVTNSALGVVCIDFNADGYSDFLVANDGERNHLWINRGDNTFDERAVSYGVSTNLFGEPEASMGIALGDVNGDMALDVFMTHIDQESNTLYTSTPQNLMIDATIGAKLGHMSVPFTGFGTVFLDADHDSDLDLVVANGRVRKTSDSRLRGDGTDFHRAYAERNLLLENVGAGVFRSACTAANAFCSSIEVSRGLLAGDIDHDGDLDLLLTNSNGRARLYRNTSQNANAWLQLRIIDPALKRDAIGALVRLKIGNQWLVRPVIHTSSYLSSADATVHFGLGSAKSVDALVVVWPDGVQESFPSIPVNQFVVLRKGDGHVEGH